MRLLGTLVVGLLLAVLPGMAGPTGGNPAGAAAIQPSAPGQAGATPPAHIPKDSAAGVHGTPKSRSDTVLVVKHSFNHKQQIITGSVIMTCLMLMMVTMNNYNPR